MTITLSSPADIARIFASQQANRWALKASTAQQRCAKLQGLRDAIVRHADAAAHALFLDLRKAPMGLNSVEIASVLREIDETMAELEEWMQVEVIEPSPRFAGNRTYVAYEPRGVCLLFGAWNFPFDLIFSPLIAMLAAGNAVIVKPNELAPATSGIVATILRESFAENEVAVFEGGIPIAESLLQIPFDHIFFTGSPAVGKRVMAAAAQHLASVTLELGGKCPVIIDAGVNLAEVAAKVAGARFFNAGQLCLSADHVWVREEQRDEFVEHLRAFISRAFYSEGQLVKARLSRIVDARNLERVKGLLDDAVARGASIVCGGAVETDDLTMHPTVLVDVALDAKIMQDEIFGPVLPVLTYREIGEVTRQIERQGKPLAMYIFSPQQAFIDDVLMHTSSGGVTVNNVLMHASESRLPFGGVNQSGMGRYSGIHGFRELSHGRAVFVQAPAAV